LQHLIVTKNIKACVTVQTSSCDRQLEKVMSKIDDPIILEENPNLSRSEFIQPLISPNLERNVA
jgi:hypothetical protein